MALLVLNPTGLALAMSKALLRPAWVQKMMAQSRVAGDWGGGSPHVSVCRVVLLF